MTIRPLNRVPIPVLGENAYGYVRRFAACLGYSKVDPFRHAMGLREFGPTSELWRWERLAALAGFPVESLLHMRWRDPAAGKNRGIVSFLGQPLRATHLSYARMRFCPSCLREDGPPEQRILRDHWALFMAPVCTKHATLLVDTCDECGDPFEYRRKTGVWSCACGRVMSDIEPRAASPAACDMAMALHSCVSATGATGHVSLSKAGILPAPFCNMPLNDLASIVDRIGIVAATPADQDEPVDGDKLKYMAGRIDQERSIADCARQIEHAYPILRDWPTGFERLIASVAGRNPVPDTAHKVRRLFATRMGQLLLDPVRGIDGKPIGLLDAALREWLRQEHGYRWGQRVDQPKIPKWKSARKFTTAPTTTSSDTMLPTKIQHRILKLQTNDTFMQASKLNALIAELWTTPGPLIVAAEADIRSRQEVKIYGRRTFPKNLYSVRDALAVMERRHGPSPLTRPRHDRGTGDLI